MNAHSLRTGTKFSLSLTSQTFMGAAIGVLLLLAVGVIFFINIFSFAESARLRQESYLSVIHLEKYFSDLKDIETGQRGYILTGRESYLAPYKKGLNDIQDDWRQVSAHHVISSRSDRQLQTLKELAEQKLAEMQLSIDVFRSEGRTSAIAMINTDQGKALMNQIRDLVAQIKRQEQQEVDLRNRELSDSIRSTIVFSLVIGLMGLLLFLMVIVLLIRETNHREMLNHELEAQIGERQRINEQLQLEAEKREEAKARIDELNLTLETKVHNLDAVNKELEAFSYSVSHDLRAPLRSIDGFSQAFLSKYGDQLDETGKDYLNRVRANSQRMAQLIDDMLQLSRLTRGEMSMQKVNLSELAEEIIAECRQNEPVRQVEAKVQPDLVVKGDKRLLQAVLQNLLNNAWKFTSAHESAHIEFGAFPQDDKLVYFVRDDGAGFEMEYVHKLFGAFQRLHAMHEFPGTGVGLATVQRIIHRHGGKVWAEGKPEQGACFYFTINTEAMT